MRTLLIGSDFMYNKDGKLVPVEINTNVGMSRNYVEDEGEVFDFTELTKFLLDGSFSRVTYIGALRMFHRKLRELCVGLSIGYAFIDKDNGITIPDIEDSPDHLIIRSAYDSTAIVDEEYCKDKVNFLKLISGADFGSQFAYYSESKLINNITDLPDNGPHPNLILKAIAPRYNHENYPKLFRATSQEELDRILAKHVDALRFMMVYHFNPDHLYEGHVQVFRSMNLLFPPDLKSIPIGRYTKLTERIVTGEPRYDEYSELIKDDRVQYISRDGYIDQPKLMDGDLVEMADGTFKTAIDLSVGDEVKSVILPDSDDADLYGDIYAYSVPYDRFVTETVYTTNKITEKWRVDKLVDYVKITFSDGTDWEDTANSNYLVNRNDTTLFVSLYGNGDNSIAIGDEMILLDTSDKTTVKSILKNVTDVKITKTIFSGWEMVVEDQHLFLTQTSPNDPDNISYATIEHNPTICYSPDCSQKGCGTYVCCSGTCRTPAQCDMCLKV